MVTTESARAPERPELAGRAGWYVVVAYSLACAATQILWLSYAPITNESARHYGVSVGAIGWLSEIFPLLYVLLAIPAGASPSRPSAWRCCPRYR